MNRIFFKTILFSIALIFLSCKDSQPVNIEADYETNKAIVVDIAEKEIKTGLPTVGLLVYEGFLTMEMTAPLNVFAKFDADGNQVFNLVIVGEELKEYISEEGLRVTPDFTFGNVPKLDALIVPSAMNMESAIANEDILNFIRKQKETTQYMASNCAGAFLLGASGVANGKKIVTYVTGGKLLQETFPELKVQDDAVVSYMEDGKIISSNGNFSSYISAFELLEKMSTVEHRNYVEEYLYLNRLKKWPSSSN
ncbi:transcriptional regulator GlxA family with amidase domain [Saonia flava]|uniref:Transcriptional regulator GlxA family with amidase domain n=1 Tax=Saonia flava TaxID=523696 RepID=A0A846R5Q2_9FLAO|nr:DJ-1/PfpI family protein [Saonia flava]NJB72704.1 transcriptional regulator GlxA family with amidase domain [Saonia flava]